MTSEFTLTRPGAFGIGEIPVRHLVTVIGKPTGRFVHDNASGITAEEYDRDGATVYDCPNPLIPRLFVASFRDLTHPPLFFAALALAENNAEVQADPQYRRNMHVCVTAIAGRWYVVDDDTEDRLAVAIFADRDDADLFVQFLAP